MARVSSAAAAKQRARVKVQRREGEEEEGGRERERERRRGGVGHGRGPRRRDGGRGTGGPWTNTNRLQPRLVATNRSLMICSWVHSLFTYPLLTRSPISHLPFAAASEVATGCTFIRRKCYATPHVSLGEHHRHVQLAITRAWHPNSPALQTLSSPPDVSPKG